jgi:hypothetical protein
LWKRTLRNFDSSPASLVEKVRSMALKREQQAAKAADDSVAQELSTTARNYRALADALAKTTSLDTLLDKTRGKPS